MTSINLGTVGIPRPVSGLEMYNATSTAFTESYWKSPVSNHMSCVDTKPVLIVSDQVRHKLGCTTEQKMARLRGLNLGFKK